MTKTDDLIDDLARDLTPVRQHALRLRLATAFGVGLVGATLVLLASLAFRQHQHHVTEAAFWVKFLYMAMMMTAAIVALEHVARPDGSLKQTTRVALAAIGVVAILAIVQLAQSPTTAYPGLIFGFSALICPFLIALFGLPAFFANMWFLRRGAPMNPGLAGFVAGACAGATGGWVYSWACVENGMPFIAIWYTSGVLLSGIAGALVGQFRLRW